MKLQKLDQLFKSFNGLNVLIIGDVMVDAYVWGKVSRISPEAPVPIVSVSKTENRLGGAANVALNIKAMGAQPILCSVIGADAGSAVFLQLLKAEKMSTSGIITAKERITTTKTRILGNQHQMLRVDEEICTTLSADLQKSLLKKVADLIAKQKIDALIFEDYDKGTLSEGLITKLIQLAKRNGIPTAVDPKKDNFLAYKGVSLFKPNLRELKEGLNSQLDLSQQSNLRKAVDQLNKKIASEQTLITLSERGVYIRYANNDKCIPAHLRSISDVSGAGDTVIAVAALCLARKCNPVFIAALSNLAGGLVCEKVGVVPIDKKQLQQEAEQLLQSYVVF